MSSSSFFSSHKAAQARADTRAWRASRRLRPGCLQSGWRPSPAKSRRVSVQIVVGHLPKARHHRLEPFLDLLLPGRGNARQRAAVEGVERGDDLEPALVVAELARELEQAFVGLAAAVAEKAFARADAS